MIFFAIRIFNVILRHEKIGGGQNYGGHMTLVRDSSHRVGALGTVRGFEALDGNLDPILMLKSGNGKPMCLGPLHYKNDTCPFVVAIDYQARF